MARAVMSEEFTRLSYEVEPTCIRVFDFLPIVISFDFHIDWLLESIANTGGFRSRLRDCGFGKD